MIKLSLSDVKFLLGHLIRCYAPYDCGLSGASIHNMESDSPAFVHLGKTWSLGTVFSESRLKWGEFQQVFSEVFQEEIEK